MPASHSPAVRVRYLQNPLAERPNWTATQSSKRIRPGYRATEPVNWLQAMNHERAALDPTDWEAFRKTAYAAVDEVIARAQAEGEGKAWQPMPEDSWRAIDHDLAEEGVGEQATWELAKKHVLPYRLGNVHPRYWTRLAGSGFPLAALSDFLASAMNSNAAGQESSATKTELVVLRWLKQMLGFPAEATGVLTSGCSAAHLVALTVCRNEHASRGVSEEGYCVEGDQLVLYCSEETHSSIDKAVAILGIGTDNLRKVRTDEHFRIDLEALRSAISKDRSAGKQPCCVVGNAGTIATGAIDDLAAIADLCDKEGLWFHIDGAFGAFAVLSPELKPRAAGIERADSIAFDLHKWMQMPYDIGCVLIRDGEANRRAFTHEASYLAATARGPAASSTRFYELGIDLSRSFRAFKVWMGLTAYGLAPFRQIVQQNVDQARYLAGLIEASPNLELAAPVDLNVVCFRYRLDQPPAREDAFNEELVLRIQESGVAVIGTVMVRDRLAIRLGIVNRQSQLKDFDLLIKLILSTAEHMETG